MSALLIKPTEGKTVVKALGEILYKIKPKDSKPEVSSLPKGNGG